MPIIQISLLQGRSEALVSQCAREVARTVHDTLGAPLDTIRVLVTELPPTHWAVGERTRADIDAARQTATSEGRP